MSNKTLVIFAKVPDLNAKVNAKMLWHDEFKNISVDSSRIVNEAIRTISIFFKKRF